MLIDFDGKKPKVGKNVFIAPTAVIIGDVELGDGCSVWFNAVIRGDDGPIRIGAGSNVQDNATIHVPTKGSTTLHENVTIGHGATLEGCEIGAHVVVGMNAVVLERAEVGERVMIGAGSVVKEGERIPGSTLVAGVPAKIKKKLEGGAQEWIKISAGEYYRLRDNYIAQKIDKGGRS